MWFLQCLGIMSKKSREERANIKRKNEKKKKAGKRKGRWSSISSSLLQSVIAETHICMLLTPFDVPSLPLQIRLPSALVNVVYICTAEMNSRSQC